MPIKKQQRWYGRMQKHLFASLVAVIIAFSISNLSIAKDDTATKSASEIKSKEILEALNKSRRSNKLNLLKIRKKQSETPTYVLPQPNAQAGVGDPRLSLRIKDESAGKNFLYLKKTVDTSSPIGLIDSILSPKTTDLIHQSSRIGFVINPDKNQPYGTGFEVSLQGNMFLSLKDNILGHNTQEIEDKQYSVGLSLGYSGFNIDALLLDQSNSLSNDYEGYGFGLSYTTQKLLARFGYQDLTLKDSQLNNELLYSAHYSDAIAHLNALEFTAAYNLSNNWRLTGGIRYSLYGKPIFGLDGVDQDNTKSFYLGTRWSF